MNDLSIGRVLILIAVIIFVLVVFGVSLGSISQFELLSAGLAFFAAGHLV